MAYLAALVVSIWWDTRKLGNGEIEKDVQHWDRFLLSEDVVFDD
jgi:hypothetical protein